MNNLKRNWKAFCAFLRKNKWATTIIVAILGLSGITQPWKLIVENNRSATTSTTNNTSEVQNIDSGHNYYDYSTHSKTYVTGDKRNSEVKQLGQATKEKETKTISTDAVFLFDKNTIIAWPKNGQWKNPFYAIPEIDHEKINFEFTREGDKGFNSLEDTEAYLDKGRFRFFISDNVPSDSIIKFVLKFSKPPSMVVFGDYYNKHTWQTKILQ